MRFIVRCRAAGLLYHAFLAEREFACPYCGQDISMVLDLSVGRQSYVEDCEVCCKPIEIGHRRR
jgi:transcription elongation factor Elf1